LFNPTQKWGLFHARIVPAAILIQRVRWLPRSLVFILLAPVIAVWLGFDPTNRPLSNTKLTEVSL
jgi:hypothetical protein